MKGARPSLVGAADYVREDVPAFPIEGKLSGHCCYLESSSAMVCCVVLKRTTFCLAKHLLATAYGPRHMMES